MTATANTMIARMMPVESAPVRPSSSVWLIALGRPATMPEKMISEMPLPMPRAVICSPSHIRNMVPPVSVMTRGDAEEPARIGDDAAAAFEADGDAVGLHGGQDARCRSACTG